MPDEIVGGDTLEGAVPTEVGDAAGSTADTPDISPDAGIAPASAPVELPEALRDRYVEVERYQNLESKLGNWSETERLAQLAQQLQSDPRIIAALQPQQQPSQPEQIPDFSTMEPEKVLEYLDQRSEQRAQKLLDERFAKFNTENVTPLQEAVFNRQAQESIQKMEAKYPDFKEQRQAISELLTKVPALAESEEGLEMAYKSVTWEKQQQTGAKNAVTKLQNKSKETTTRPQGSAPSGKAKPKSIADAWLQAEEGTV